MASRLTEAQATDLIFSRRKLSSSDLRQIKQATGATPAQIQRIRKYEQGYSADRRARKQGFRDASEARSIRATKSYRGYLLQFKRYVGGTPTDSQTKILVNRWKSTKGRRRVSQSVADQRQLAYLKLIGVIAPDATVEEMRTYVGQAA